MGKSSTATLVAEDLGYHVMELNASDTRNKKSLSEELETVIGNQVNGTLSLLSSYRSVIARIMSEQVIIHSYSMRDDSYIRNGTERACKMLHMWICSNSLVT